MDDVLVEQDGGFEMTRGALKGTAKLWEDGVLPVTLPEGISADRRRTFFEACSEWSRVAHVRCVEGAYKGRTLRVTAYGSMGCFCLWGMGSNFLVLRRWMNLGDGCWKKPTIMHEMGHAFGLIHEHQRPDRDDYVAIHRENLYDPYSGLMFLVNYDHQAAQLLTPYDFTSIMHYRRDAGSKNGGDTLVPLPKYSSYVNVMGNVKSLSRNDARSMTALYGPPVAPVADGKVSARLSSAMDRMLGRLASW